jgi:hypothetical protein
VAVTDHTIPLVLARAWEQQRLWSLTANRLKDRLDRARAAALVLTLASAVLAVAAVQVTGPPAWIGPALGAAAAVAAGFATVLQRGVSTEQISIWTRARSASEGLKTEIYSYMAGGSAYGNIADRDQRLRERARSLVDQVGDLERYTLGVTADDKPLPRLTGVEDYLTHRIENQIQHYYRPKAAHYERRVRILRTVATALGVATVVLAALAGMSSVAPFHGLQALAAWAPVGTTAATAVASHIAAARYDYLIIEYLRTAGQLEHLRDAQRDTSGNPATFIDDCEQVISVENQGWMTRWTIEDVPGTAQ